MMDERRRDDFSFVIRFPAQRNRYEVSWARDADLPGNRKDDKDVCDHIEVQ